MRILYIILISLLISSKAYSAEIIDCSKETNLLKKINCKAKNLKSTLNEKQAETKEKISNTAKDLKAKVED